jgi:hypothetical protein
MRTPIRTAGSSSSCRRIADQTAAVSASLARQPGQCESSRGGRFAVRLALDAADRFARQRLITVLVLLVVTVGTTWHLL